MDQRTHDQFSPLVLSFLSVYSLSSALWQDNGKIYQSQIHFFDRLIDYSNRSLYISYVCQYATEQQNVLKFYWLYNIVIRNGNLSKWIPELELWLSTCCFIWLYQGCVEYYLDLLLGIIMTTVAISWKVILSPWCITKMKIKIFLFKDFWKWTTSLFTL